jgi:ketosteroid isomerase-like protein
MRGWTQTLVLSLCTAAVAASAPAVQARSHDPSYWSLIRTERDFAAMVDTQGVKAGYMKYLSDDSVMLTYTGTDLARPFYASLPAVTTWTLQWAPAAAEVSRAGDLGYTQGSGSINEGGKRYPYTTLLLWERNAAGQWRVAMDDSAWARTLWDPVDSEQRGPTSKPTPPLRNLERNTRLQALVRTDRALVRALMTNPATAYPQFRRADCLFLRDLHPPRIGAEADPMLATYPARPLDSLELTRLSASGDMAFTVGLWPGKGGPAAYTRVWRYEDRRWVLAVDSTHYPPPEAGVATAAPHKPARR